MKGAVSMKGIIKFIFKIIAIPFIVGLTIIVPFLTFIFCLSEWICTVAAVLVAGLGFLGFFTGNGVFNSIVLIVIGFLISPFGLRSVIEWFIDLLDELNYSLKGFVVS